MADLAHTFGADLALSATGDLATVSGPNEVTQRVIHRLLTNSGAYIWQLQYGAGLGAMVGSPVNLDAIGSIVRAQIFQEAAVAQAPPPSISLAQNQTGTVTCSITYADAQTGQAQSISFGIPA